MAAVGSVFVLLVVLLVVVGSFGLYYFVRAEHGQRSTMDREAAERAARQDTPEREPQQADTRRER